MMEFQHYESVVPYLDEVTPPRRPDNGEGLLSRLLEIPEGRVALAKMMVEPIRIELTYRVAEDFE